MKKPHIITQLLLFFGAKCHQRKWPPLYGLLTNCVIKWGFFTIFVNDFVRNVSATVSYGRKELLDIRTAITHLGFYKDFFNNNNSSSKQDSHDILQTPHRADIPIIHKRK